MDTDYSTAEGQKQLMRESVGQPTDFPRPASHSGFKPGQILDFKDLNLRHPSNRVEYLREGKPEHGLPVITVKHRSGTTGEWLARDFQCASIQNRHNDEVRAELAHRAAQLQTNATSK